MKLKDYKELKRGPKACKTNKESPMVNIAKGRTLPCGVSVGRKVIMVYSG